jgi:hypothetical protein
MVKMGFLRGKEKLFLKNFLHGKFIFIKIRKFKIILFR